MTRVALWCAGLAVAVGGIWLVHARSLPPEPRIGTQTLAFGATTRIDQYEVAVTDVDTSQGQPVVVTVAAKHVGSGVARPDVDLAVGYAGSDFRDYPPVTCPARHTSTSRELVRCFDVPADAISGGRVFVAEGMSRTSRRTYWEINT